MTGQIRTKPRGGEARLLSLGSFRPERVVSNAEILERIDSSDEWIRSRSGIENRRFAGPEETVSAMAAEAGGKALAHAGLGPADVDVIIVATATHLMQTPSAATEVALRLGVPAAAAFDIGAACAGFCHGLALAADMIRAGTCRHVLVIGSEKLSDFLNPEDRATAFIFGDGAGAAVVGPADEPGIGPVVWGSDTSGIDLIRQDHAWDRAYAHPDGPHWPYLEMDGNPVFRWAAFEMAKAARQALDAAGVGVDQLDAFVPHQANMRITDAMARALKLPPSVAIARDIAHQGNTSAASVPLALDRMVADGHIGTGSLALVIGFGAGLVYAAQVIRIP
jgi:3-oxoacyl-[acyl-carrier-protein] synthase III